MRKLSTGEDSTLGNWKKLTGLIIGPKAEAFIDQKIAESPNGENEEVLADESQFINVLFQIENRR